MNQKTNAIYDIIRRYFEEFLQNKNLRFKIHVFAHFMSPMHNVQKEKENISNIASDFQASQGKNFHQKLHIFEEQNIYPHLYNGFGPQN